MTKINQEETQQQTTTAVFSSNCSIIGVQFTFACLPFINIDDPVLDILIAAFPEESDNKNNKKEKTS